MQGKIGSLSAEQKRRKKMGQATTFSTFFMFFTSSTFSRCSFLSALYCQSFPGSSAGKESACNAGELVSIPRLGRSPGEGKSYPLPYSGLENSMDCIDHGVAKSLTRVSDFHFHTFTCTARAVSSAPSALELISNKLKLVFHGVGAEEGRQ